jgi:hypothetical protein
MKDELASDGLWATPTGRDPIGLRGGYEVSQMHPRHSVAGTPPVIGLVGAWQMGRQDTMLRKNREGEPVVTLIDKRDGAPRHPEKAHRPDTPVQRKPAWIRVKAPGSRGYANTAEIVRTNRLHTVCEEAGCPNIG